MRPASLVDLFKYRATSSIEPLENFTSAALAVAIRHDPGPFLQVLKTVADWQPDLAAPVHAGSLAVDLSELTSVEAATQVRLGSRNGVELGILDLVLTLYARSGARQEVWIEVKVDARFGENQPQAYMRQRAESGAFLVTLTKRRESFSGVPALYWDQVHEAASTVPGRTLWADIREWLTSSGIVPAPLPGPLGTWSDYVDVFRGVNDELRRLWPDVPGGLHSSPPALTRMLRFNEERQGRIYLSAQCLSYGVRMGDDGKEWWIAIGDGNSFQRTRVPVDDVITAARRGKLQGWTLLDGVYRLDRFDVFEKTRLCAGDQPKDAVAWFVSALGEISDSNVINPYIKKRWEREPG